MIKVLVVDDSPLVRQLLTHLLSDAPNIKVVGTAEDPYEAREQIKKLHPDVLTLDIEMPKMDGIAFLRNLMKLKPMPVIMVSTLTEKGAAVTLEALSLGAIDFILKPKSDLTSRIMDYREELIEKIHFASKSKIRPHTPLPKPSVTKSISSYAQNKVIAIGASTGGTEAIQRLICQLPNDISPIVIAQHIPAAFSTSFAKRLNNNASMTVIEAKGGEKLMPGTAYLAPGCAHLIVERRGMSLYTKLLDTDPVNRHRPSVDVLFDSVAESIGKSALGVILTGMGKDGAKGLLNMKNKGCFTVAQDEASSVVWGMPGAAVDIKATNEVLHIDRIPPKLLSLLNKH